jgi:hypothetical protein
MVKSWFESKLFWLGVLQVLIGAGQLLSEFFTKGVYDASAITLLIVGFLTVILRYFFTDTKLQ